MPKILRITTVPISLNILLKGQFGYMNSQGFEVVAASSDGPEVHEIIEREGIKHCVIPLTREITPIKDLTALWVMYKLIRKLKPDIIHSHTPKAGLIAMLAGKMAGTKVRLHTIAGLPLLEARGLKRNILHFTERLTIWGAHYAYPNSYVMLDILKNQLGVNSKKLKVIASGSSNGIDTDHFKPTERIDKLADQLRVELGLNSEEEVLVFIGRIVKDKGINELVEVFIDLRKTRFNLKLLLVGPFEDDLDPINDETRRHIDANDSIITTGFVQDVRPYLALCDIFVFPSYREGFPNVVMQSLCMDVPCVVSDINGCNEIIINGHNGIVVKPKSTEDLKRGVATILDNKEMRVEMSKKARTSVIERYDQKMVWGALLEEYKSLLDV